MEAPAVSQSTLDSIQIATDYGSWWWFLFIFIVFSVIWYFISGAMDAAEIAANWPKYRCSPSVMPFASAYGYDTAENFNYCMRQILQGQLSGTTGPFVQILSTMTQNLMTILQNLNSLRVMLATLVGSISKLMQEFVDRFKLTFSQIRLASMKIQMMTRRLFGTFYSIIYMGLSVVMVGQNFSDTVIFRFLDTFCFSPETQIEIQGRGRIPIQDVQLGDVCTNGSRVMSTYQFEADGQSMVKFGSIDVSTNHLVQQDGVWRKAEDHRDARPTVPWSGGRSRPLICIDTDTHEVPIDNWIFSDWDETHDSDEGTMKLAETILNNGRLEQLPRDWNYQPAFSPTTMVVLKDGSTKRVCDLQLGDTLTTGIVSGLGKRLVSHITTTEYGTLVTPSTLVWKEDRWIRCGHISMDVLTLEKESVYYIVLVKGSASIETATGEVFRDMLEVHSPDMEEPTTRTMMAS